MKPPVEAQPAASPPVATRWAVRSLVLAPHRMFFFVASVLLALSLAWWTWDIAARYLPLTVAALPAWLVPRDLPVPAGWLHAVQIIYAALPAYIFGFSLTAMPRWLSRAPVPGGACVACGAVHLAGGIALLLGFVVTGLALLSLSWTLALHLIITRVYRGAHPDKRHASLLLLALVIGWCGLLAGLVGAAGQVSWLLRVGIVAGLWGMLLPINLVVAHRMLPFFTANVFPGAAAWRPFTALYLLLASSVVYGVSAELSWSVLAALSAGTAALITGLFAWRWQVRGLFSNRMLVMLHVGHAWLPVAFTLALVQHAASMAGYLVLGNAPLHALTMGFLLSTVVAMVSRVSLGHSGRNVSADLPTWWIFWLLQVFTVFRIASEVMPWPAQWPHAYVWVAGGVCATMLWWAWRYVPIYLKARADGAAG